MIADVAVADLLAKATDRGVEVEAIERVGQQRGGLLVLDVQAAQGLFIDVADLEHLLQRGFAERRCQWIESAQEPNLFPLDRAFDFALPGARPVVLDLRCIGIGASRVLHAKPSAERILGNDVLLALQVQDFFALMRIQPGLIRPCAGGQFQRVPIRHEIRVPHFHPAIRQRHRFEVVDKRRRLDRGCALGQHMPRAHQRQLGKVEDHAVDVRAGLFLVAVTPVFNALGKLCEQLADHHAEHHLADARHQHHGEIEDVPADLQITDQTVPAAFGIFIVSGHCDESCISERLVPFAPIQVRPEIALNRHGDRLGLRIFNRRLPPPWPHVQRFTLMPGYFLEALVGPFEESRFVFLSHKPAEKLLIGRLQQLRRQGFHERCQRWVFFQRVQRIIWDVGNQRPVENTLIVEVATSR